mmetsp:Transcript_88847/g.287721  ORF Transcript_88847/g.287721 Transcript_88847/m.287721 type:complete len:281 (-) Transcript_88847:317-1159(-)
MPLQAQRKTAQSPAASSSTGGSEGRKSCSSSCRPWAPAMSNFGENQLVCSEALDRGVEGRRRCETFWMTQSTRRVERFSTSDIASFSFVASWSREARRVSASSRSFPTSDCAACSTRSLRSCEATWSSWSSSFSRSIFRLTSPSARTLRSFASSRSLCTWGMMAWHSWEPACARASTRSSASFRSCSMARSTSLRCLTISSAASLAHFSLCSESSAFRALSCWSNCAPRAWISSARATRTSWSTAWILTSRPCWASWIFLSIGGKRGSNSLLTLSVWASL